MLVPTAAHVQCLHLPSASFLQIQCGQDKLCVLPSALFPPAKILGVFGWEGTKDWNHPAGLLEHVAGIGTLSTCTFGPWKGFACQDGGTHQLLAGTSEQRMWQAQLIPISIGNNNLLHVSKCLNRILGGLFQFFSGNNLLQQQHLIALQKIRMKYLSRLSRQALN